ncbi:M28 family peptidase [Pontibacter sp. SGAir0037]|uniref:M28 family peptidase n=1 Tax=Pontibacter sp. SGAir0037 TaxID=2571030 RepID=UPI0010CCF1B8|nr:M28 family peptidase [Pontibacter sp. SGAir0037]QCR23119.1 peptidase M28 [Pontibacter sp. SGAir0037]
MKRIYSLLLLGGLLYAGNAFSQEVKLEKKVEKSLKKVKPNDIKNHIAYLADDKLKGRLPGTEGYQMAVDYVIGKYTAMGIEPAGENGTYLQRVRIRKSVVAPSATASFSNATGTEETLAYGKDFALYPNLEEQNVTANVPLVFAGFGISAPDMGYDDYASVDARGKIVVVFRGAPASFPSTVASASMDTQVILQTAADHGAVGVIMASSNPTAPVGNLQRGVNSVMGPDGKVAVSRTFNEQIKLFGLVTEPVFQKLVQGSGLETEKTIASLKAGTPVSTALTTSLKASYTSSYEDIESYNVVGRITGSDPQLKNEYIVHSAHLDHVGIGRPINGDSIYNGAHDNASGVASLLEIGKIYSRIKAKPKRSVLLVMVTAEEMGLLGSAYFAKNPTVPKENIVADINTDMPTIIAPLLSAVPLGAAHSTLEQQVMQASAYLGIDIEEDPEPEQNRFVRSDQYSFVSNGIPALHIKYGNKTADGKNNLDQFVKEWREVYYHKPQDGMDGIFDFEAGKRYVQLNFLIGYLVAQSSERPSWKPGDYFGERFGQATSSVK